jgi:iron(III) transport system permease protein
MVVRALWHPDLFVLLWEPTVLKSLARTVTIALGSLVLALALGAPTSYLLTRTNLPGKSFFKPCFLFPFFMPSYLFAIAWTTLALPKVGIINRLLNIDWLNVYSLPGLIAVTTNAFFPIIVTALSKGFQTMDPSLEEAARVCGAKPITVFFRVTLPCQISSIIGASITFLLIVASSFGIPAILGTPAHLFVLTTDIYTHAKMGGITGADQGFIISLWLILLSIVLSSLGQYFRSRWAVPLVSGKSSRESVVDLGKWGVICQAALLALIAIMIIIPLLSLIISSFLRVAGDLHWSNFTMDNYAYIFSLREGTTALFNSLSLHHVD